MVVVALTSTAGAVEPLASGPVVLFSDHGDFVGAGHTRVYRPDDSQIVAGWRDKGKGYVTISASGGSRGHDASLDFAAPPGHRLRRGIYDDAERAPFRAPGRPGIDITVHPRGCNVTAGRFEVKDIAVRSDGRIKRLWIVFEQHCEAALTALYGEVRLGVPAGDAGWYTTPAILRWPESDVGRATTTSSATVVATRAVRLKTIAVTGRSAPEFPVRADHCSGRLLDEGGQCAVAVQFVPHTTGTHRAVLRITDAAGHRRKVPLQGFAHGGRTSLVMHSDPGDYIGKGNDFSFTPANAVFALNGNRRFAAFRLWQPNGSDWADATYWGAGFFPPKGGTLAPGRYAGATKGPDNTSSPGLIVTTDHIGCDTVNGEFTIAEATFSAAGVMRTLGLDFTQHCDGAVPALRGTLEVRRGDRTPPAPWMAGGRSHRCADPPVIRGTARADSIKGTRAADTIRAGAGSDTVRARRGRDCVEGGRGKDVLGGARGSDRLYGGRGNDRLSGGPGRDVLNCGRGRDVAVATTGDEVTRCERVIRPRRG